MQEPDEEYETPRVSPYRLAAHLGSAFAIYSILVWTTFSLAIPKQPLQGLPQAQSVAAQALKGWALPLSALIAITGMSGTSLCNSRLLRKLCGWMLFSSLLSLHIWRRITEGYKICRSFCCGFGCWPCLQYIPSHGRPVNSRRVLGNAELEERLWEHSCCPIPPPAPCYHNIICSRIHLVQVQAKKFASSSSQALDRPHACHSFAGKTPFTWSWSFLVFHCGLTWRQFLSQTRIPCGSIHQRDTFRSLQLRNSSLPHKVGMQVTDFTFAFK